MISILCVAELDCVHRQGPVVVWPAINYDGIDILSGVRRAVVDPGITVSAHAGRKLLSLVAKILVFRKLIQEEVFCLNLN